jgi:hypothetical protein
MMMRLGGAFFLTLLAATAARGQAPDMSCSNGGFPAETAIGLAKVIGADRLVFLKDTDGCPSEAASCRQRAYVVSGDELLTGRSAGGYVCAFFPNRGGGSAGWVQRTRLQALPVEGSPPLSAWAGHWSNGDDTINLTVEGGALVADGNAYWPSAHPSLSQFPGGPNLGDLSGTARPSGARLVFADPDPQACAATLTLVGGLVVVSDNGACGGQNVSFSGVYSRR